MVQILKIDPRRISSLTASTTFWNWIPMACFDSNTLPYMPYFCPSPSTRVKFGEPFEIEVWGAVIVEVAAIGLARFLGALRLGCGQRRSNE
jgi:hypothetical protein